MNKLLYALVYLTLIHWLAPVNAQAPTLNANNTNPVLGDYFELNVTGYVDEGPSGPNQTWDFSDLSEDSKIPYQYIAPSATPYSNSFPDATLAVSISGGYDYYNTTSNAYQRVGGYVSGTIIPYSDSQDQLRFPFTYQSSYTDNFSTTFVSQGTTISRSGTFTLEGDGYGTLKLPFGTFTDVLRVRADEVYVDNYTIQGIPQQINYETIAYIWYKPGIHLLLLGISTFESDIDYREWTQYIDPTTVGIHDLKEQPSIALSVYPNPAISVVDVRYELKQKGAVRLSLLNTLGQTVATMKEDVAPGTYHHTFDVSAYSPGLYFVKAESEDRVVNKTVMIK